MADPLRRNRDFTLLWCGQVLSTVGTRISSVGYPLLVLLITGSPAWAGVVAFAQTLPYVLLTLPAGAWVDGWDRRRTMVACELGRAVALGSVAAVVLLGGVGALPVWQLAAVAFAEGCLFVLFDLAEGAALPRLVTAEQVPAAVAWNQARTQGADLVGQPLGRALFAVAPGLPFVVDAVTYLVSGGAVAAIRTRLPAASRSAGESLRARIGVGIRYVRASPFLRSGVVVVGAMNLVFNAMVLALVVRAQQLGASAGTVGLVLGGYGLGGVLGALAAPAVHRRLPERAIVVGVAWLWAALLPAVALAPDPRWLGVGVALVALPGPAFNVVVMARIYRTVPEDLLARVRSALRLVSWGTIPLGSLAGGLLADRLGGGGALLVVGVAMAPVAVLATRARGFR